MIKGVFNYKKKEQFDERRYWKITVGIFDAFGQNQIFQPKEIGSLCN